MMIADLFGAGVFPCGRSRMRRVSEMIQVGQTGLLFRTAEELATQLRTLLGGARDASGTLARLRWNVARVAATRWSDAWHESAPRPVLLP